MKKIGSIFWALLFVAFALFQYNDPDGWVWMMIYGIAALLSLMVLSANAPRFILWLALLVFLVAAIWLWPPVYDGLTLEHGFTPAIEEARESLGLLICGVAMVWHLVVTRSR